VILCAAVPAIAALGIALGARAIAPAVVLQALISPDPALTDHVVVRELRLPRTLTGLAVGAALGLAGALIQALTRNPIADPGLLGVNAGASLAVVVAITWFGVASTGGYMMFALAGAAAAAALVHSIGTRGREGETPVRLALVGSAVTAAATSLISVVLLRDIETLERYRLWVVGSLAGRDLGALAVVAPLMAAGALTALCLGAALNALALGDDASRALGRHPGRVRALTGLSAVALCGGATALAGPIVFVGLVVPHIAARIAGPDWRRICVLCVPLGAMMLVLADIAGRLIARPGEIEAGIVVAFIGAPVLIALVRRGRWERM
jgi:iron complex transport system permease protein